MQPRYENGGGSPWWAWFGGICGCIVCLGIVIWLIILTVNQSHFITEAPVVQGVGAVVGVGAAGAAAFAAAAKSSAANSAAAIQAAVGRRQGGGNNAAQNSAARWAARAGGKKNK